MGLTFEEAKLLGIESEHPDHPSRRKDEAKPKRNKYGAVRTEYNGRKYDSKSEAIHAERLDYEKSAGLIRNWIPQVTFLLGSPPITYRLDFLVWNCDGSTEGHETKGKKTEKAKIIFKAWEHVGPCVLKVYTNGKLMETIIPRSCQ